MARIILNALIFHSSKTRIESAGDRQLFSSARSFIMVNIQATAFECVRMRLAFWPEPQVAARSTLFCLCENSLKVQISFRSGAHLIGDYEGEKRCLRGHPRNASEKLKEFHRNATGLREF
jgi:hypothetical protein